MQAVRAAMFAGIVLAIHAAHARRTAEQVPAGSIPIDIEQVLEFYPTGLTLDPAQSGTQIVRDGEGKILGYVLQTSPTSDGIVGYSGPTNTLLAFDANDLILGTKILQSADTREHVAAIKDSPRFRFTWNGMNRQAAASLKDVDAVSGSTLTSIAIQQGLQKRLGGNPPNLKFPIEVTLEEAHQLFPDANSLSPSGLKIEVLDSQNELIGYVVRSSPYADHITGYQGPTDVLLAFDVEDRLVGFQLRESYDNDPYVGYVREDEYFRNSLNGKSLPQLAELDLIAEQVEGVSGATMTSMSVADSLVATGQAVINAQDQDNKSSASSFQSWSPAPRDYGTLLILIAGLTLAFTKLRGIKPIRIGYQVCLIVYLGFLNGDMVSQAFLVGAAQHGLPWKSAFGLSTLSVAALLIPLTTRKQVYCHQLCPHGAVQQLVKGRFFSPRTLPQKLSQTLSLLPAALLLLLVISTQLAWPLNLASIEPFDAYLFRVAGVATISIAIVGLVVSCFVPMAYCRYGCPTGAMLGFLRKHARSDRWSRRDTFALSLMLIAAGLWLS
jgi:Na+-translocating ferredoxin:NAD+ oxidoreductase RnfG subunit